MIKKMLSKIRSLFKKKSGKLGKKHITKSPVNIRKSYYKKSKKGNHRYYIWVLVCDEGIIHTRMPSAFKPPKNALVVRKYAKGHRPRVFS